MVSVLIVNWNGKKLLMKCLRCLYKSDFKDFEVILIDNGSSDGSLEYVVKKYPLVRIVPLTRNLGFAEANNIGYKLSRGKFVYFLNNDAFVKKDTLRLLVGYLKSKPSVGGVQSKILSLRHKDRLDSAGSFLTKTGFLFHYGYLQRDAEKYNKEMKVHTAKGASMMFRRSVIERTGLFDNNFFANFEESDFCHRVWLAGYTVVYYPLAEVVHYIGKTSNSMDSHFIQYHSYKNRINSYIKNLGTRELIKIMPLHFVLIIFTSIAYLFVGKVRVSFSILKAIIWNLFFLPRTLRERRIVQTEIRKVNDSSFMKSLTVNVSLRYFLWLFFGARVKYREPDLS